MWKDTEQEYQTFSIMAARYGITSKKMGLSMVIYHRRVGTGTHFILKEKKKRADVIMEGDLSSPAAATVVHAGNSNHDVSASQMRVAGAATRQCQVALAQTKLQHMMWKRMRNF